MEEALKPPESGDAVPQAGIPAALAAWPNVVRAGGVDGTSVMEAADSIAAGILEEAIRRVLAPIEVAESEMYKLLCVALEAVFTPEGYREIHDVLEKLRNIGFDRHLIATELTLRMAPHLPKTFSLEGPLQDTFKAAGLGSVAEVDELVRDVLCNEVRYVREVLPAFPADWYRHDWAVTQLRERMAEARARMAGETTS